MGFFEDTFTEASDTELNAHTPDVGTSWTRTLQDSTAAISAIAASDDARPPTTVADSGVVYTADATYPSADYEVQFTVVTAGAGTTRPIYVGVRYQDASNLYCVRLHAAASGYRLHKKVSDSWSALGTAVTIANGSVVKVQIIGSTLKLFDDGVEVDSVTDSDITAAGKSFVAMGGGTFGTASTDDVHSSLTVDTFSVTDLAAGGATLVADTVSFSLTGNDATLSRQVSLAVDAAAFTLSGQAAGLTVGYQLTAVVATFALTGQDATLSRQVTLAADVGAYTLTGIDVVLTYSGAGGAFSIDVTVGAFALTGQDAALTVGYQLPTVTGAYTLTGQVATLSRAVTLAAVTGTYALTGNAASFLLTYILAAAAASYILTGQDATLSHAGAVVFYPPGTRDVRRAKGRGEYLSDAAGRQRVRVREPIDAEG